MPKRIVYLRPQLIQHWRNSSIGRLISFKGACVRLCLSSLGWQLVLIPIQGTDLLITSVERLSFVAWQDSFGGGFLNDALLDELYDIVLLFESDIVIRSCILANVIGD